MKWLTLPLLLLALDSPLLAQGMLTQTLPAGYENQDAPDLTSWPLDAQSPQRWQWIYDSSHFAAQQTITIHQIAVRVAFAGLPVSAFTLPDLTISMGSSSAHYGREEVSSTFAGNTLSDLLVVRSGVFSGGPIVPTGNSVGAWIPLALQAPFVFTPGFDNDLVVELATDSGGIGLPIDVATGANGTNGGNRYGSTFSRTASNWNFTHVSSESVPVIRVDYSIGGASSNFIGPQWQKNSVGASLSVDGVTQQPSTPVFVQGPLYVNKCVSEPGIVNIAAVGVGLPWEFGFVAAPPVPGNSGGVVTGGFQALNLPLLNPNIFWLNGLQFAAPLAASPINIPFNLFVAGSYTAQLLSADPSAVDGFSLSAPNVVRVLPLGTATLAPADDDFEFLSFDAPPLCTLASFNFYGTNFDGMYVSTNGRITFGAPDADFVPSPVTALLDPPFVGVWTDLQPNVGGNIVVNISAGPAVRITYNQVPYFGQPSVSNSFVIRLNLASGDVWLQGLSGLNVGSQAAFLGLSAGTLGATDAGQSVFSVGAGTPPVGTFPMLYEYGTVGTLANGVTDIRFESNPAGYTFTCF